MRCVAYIYRVPWLEDGGEEVAWGQPVERVYEDRGDRLQLTQLVQDCQTPAIDAVPIGCVLVRRLAELGDSLQAVGDRLAALEQSNVAVIALEDRVDLPLAPLSQAELLQRLQMVQAQQQQQRLRQGHARNRVKALPPPGKAPYGYRRGKDRYALDRSTAPVVKDFFEHFLLYGSLRGSVRHLEKKYGKKIAVSTGQRWLTSPVYRGDLVYHNGDRVQDTHVPIISRAEAAQVDRLLRRNRRLPPRTASAPRSLAGLVACAACQSAMTISHVTVRRQTQDYLYLRPTACPRQPKCRALPYDQVLNDTIERICEDLPRAVANLDSSAMAGVKSRLDSAIAAKQQVLGQLPELTRSGVLDEDTADLRAYKVRTEIAALQAQLAQLPPVSLQAIAQTVSIRQFWLDLSESERRFYFREFIRQILLDRGDDGWQLRLVFIF